MTAFFAVNPYAIALGAGGTSSRAFQAVETDLGERAKNFSGGEIQDLWLA